MKNIVISILGVRLDQKGLSNRRWQQWRPNLSIVMNPHFVVDEFVLLHQPNDLPLLNLTLKDMREVSPQTEYQSYVIDFDDAWDFEQVYSQLHDFTKSYRFNPELNNYYVHISTGTHVAQICLFLLTEARYIPGKLLQTSPGKEGAQGSLHVIDLDLSRYDQIAARFEQTSQEGISYLKQGIDTKNKAFNALIAMLERVAIRSPAPILLTGKTGVGKSRLAKLLYELKKQRGMVQGKFVEVNCATLRGDNAMSALFGHTKGAFTGAMSSRAGLLKEAHNGLLFLDEIGELGLDEQAMLLSAIEDKTFMPMGSDQQTSSDFQLIAGTNRDLFEQVRQGRFREDLLARINLWTVELPSLRERLDDLEPNIQHEIQLFSHKAGRKVGFNQGAKERYLAFAYSPQAMWQANFRDLSASMTRMATLAEGGRITEQVVDDEIERLTTQWQKSVIAHDQQVIRLEKYLSQEAIAMIDQFDQLQLQSVIAVCQASSSMADAGRKLFHVSRQARSSQNDSHRLKTYLNKFGLSFGALMHHT